MLLEILIIISYISRETYDMGVLGDSIEYP